MRVKLLPISRIEYERLRELKREEHKDGWWAVFSVDPQERVWPFVCYGWTPKEDRHYVSLDEYPPLKDVAGNLLANVDELGGRFFISSEGAFFKKEGDDTPGSVAKQFVKWRAEETLRDWKVRVAPREASQGTPITIAELEAKIRGR